MKPILRLSTVGRRMLAAGFSCLQAQESRAAVEIRIRWFESKSGHPDLAATRVNIGADT